MTETPATVAPKVHPLTVIFHALEDCVKSSTQRKKIIAALAALTETDIPKPLQTAPSAAPAVNLKEVDSDEQSN